MGPRSDSSIWKIVIGLAVVCGVLVFAGGFMHRRSLEKSVLDSQDASVAYVKAKLTHDVEGIDLSEQLNDNASTALAKEVDPPGDDGLRIFAPNGTAVFTDGVEPFPADDDALLAAKAGTSSRVIDGPDLRVYSSIDGKGGRVLAVAVVVSNYTQMRKDASGGPLDAYRLPLVVLGVLLLVVGLVLMLRATKGVAPVTATAAAVIPPTRSPGGTLTGFDQPAVTPPTAGAATPTLAGSPLDAAVSEAAASALGASIASPETAATKSHFRLKREPATETAAAPKEKRSMFGRRSASEEEAPVTPAAEAPASSTALQREIAIREALEGQLEQLRTAVKTQQDEKVTATRELSAQLEEWMRRAQDAEAALELGGSNDEATARVTALEQELAQARSAAAEAVARAEQMQRAIDGAPPPDPAAEQRMAELRAQLTDAQQRASSAEQRAASIESVRDELEVRVAQLGTKASELERRASDLETSLEEANAGGDAVRAEIAALTAALAGANARVQELESAPARPAADNGASEAEITRLRGELANQMERAQAAEERIASLEADVLAAARGVSTLPVTNEPVAPRYVEEPEAEPQRDAVPADATVPPAPAVIDRYDDVWSAPQEPEPVRREPAPVEPERELRELPRPAIDPGPEATYEEPAASAVSEDDAEEESAEDDMWSLRARLADAAAKKRHHLE